VRFKRRRSLLPRISWRRGLESSEPLKGQLWTRSERALREPDVHWSLRALAATASVAECALLAWLWFGPALAVQTVNVSGAVHLTSAQVAEAAGLANSASVLSVDAEADRKRLLGMTWVRTASIEPQLSRSVVVVISEWQPVAVYHSGKGSNLYLLSDQAMVLGSVSSAGTLVDVQGPSGPDPKVGARALDETLLTALVNLQRIFPALLGQRVAGFIIDSCGDLTLVAKKGWKVYFGRVLTPEEFGTLRDKVAALKAIAGHGNVDYNSTNLDYVNVMNPTEPAVGLRSTNKASPRPSPSPVPICK
jgi:cell division septal protein FtsQ